MPSVQLKIARHFVTEYSIDRFSQDILQMTGHMPGLYWQITWRFVGPVLISVLLVASIIYRSFDKPAYYAWNADEVNVTGFSVDQLTTSQWRVGH